MRWRRLVRTVIVYALLGAVATVLSSWAIHASARWRMDQRQSHAAWHIPSRPAIVHDPYPIIPITEHPWSTLRTLPPRHNWARVNTASLRAQTFWHARGWTARAERAVAHGSFVEANGWTNENVVWFRSGWPQLAMGHGAHAGLFVDGAGAAVEQVSQAYSLAAGLAPIPHRPPPTPRPGQQFPSTDVFDRFALPLLPLWPGFAINTAFYALLLFALIRTPRVVRRALRRRGGRCVGCGYDREGLDPGAACPECGVGVRHACHAVRGSDGVP